MDRIAAARGRLSQVKADLRSPVVTHPCVQCRHYEFACTHPAIARLETNAVTGSIVQKSADAAAARSPDGECGPEGAMWEARSLPAAVMVGMLQTTAGRWLAFVALCLVVSYLSELL